MTDQTWTDTNSGRKIYIEQTDGNGNYRHKKKDAGWWNIGRAPVEVSPSDCSVSYSPIR